MISRKIFGPLLCVAILLPMSMHGYANEVSSKTRKGAPSPFGVIGKASDSKKTRQVYPGVGATPGDSRPLDADVVIADGRKNEIVYISATHPSRIGTPFREPRLIDNNVVQSTVMGQSIYVTPRFTDRPLGVFVTGSGDNDPVISLTLVPRDIPPKTIVLQVEDTPSEKIIGDRQPTESLLIGESTPYVEHLKEILKEVALGNTPSGFAKGDSPHAVAKSGELLIRPDIRYSGAHLDVFRYKIESFSKNKTLELSETAFWQKGVRAVSIYPLVRLKPGESTYAFIVADKTAFGGVNGL